MSPLIDLTFIDPIHGKQHVVVAPHWGAGSGYYVYINDYFRGQIVCTSRGWAPYIQSAVLTQDDIDAIMDKINDTDLCV